MTEGIHPKVYDYISMEDNPKIFFETSLTGIRKSAEVQTSIQLSIRNTLIHLESTGNKKDKHAKTCPLRR